MIEQEEVEEEGLEKVLQDMLEDFLVIFYLVKNRCMWVMMKMHREVLEGKNVRKR